MIMMIMNNKIKIKKIKMIVKANNYQCKHNSHNNNLIKIITIIILTN